jgi:uncharacterized membrane protein
MKTRLINIWQSLRGSFWFIPALMVLAAVIMSWSMVVVDRVSRFEIQRFGFGLFSVSPEGARSVLSTIAGSMITVAGVTFSITIVVLNLASSQFGPRLLRNFMQDRNIQFVLGTFLASFIYCLFVLRAIDTVGQDIFVPGLSVTLAVLLALLNVGVLIFFIHHIATSIQADEVVAGISRELELCIRRNFSDDFEHGSRDEHTFPSLQDERKNDHHYRHSILADRNGYLQAIDSQRLFEMAREKEYRIALQVRPGQFLVAGSIIAIVSSEMIFDMSLTDVITGAFIIGDQRTQEQDVEYSVHQLVEVAVRALSPGINDPYTAMACVDQLGSALCFLAGKKFPTPYSCDEKGRLCLVVRPVTFSGILNTSFDQIRQYGRTSVAVTIRLLETLAVVAEQTRHSEQRSAIYRQSEMIYRASQETLPEVNDKRDVQERYQVLLQVLNTFENQEMKYTISREM